MYERVEHLYVAVLRTLFVDKLVWLSLIYFAAVFFFQFEQLLILCDTFKTSGSNTDICNNIRTYATLSNVLK